MAASRRASDARRLRADARSSAIHPDQPCLEGDRDGRPRVTDRSAASRSRTTGYQGTVRANAPFIPIDKQQARCMKSEHVRPLRGHYLHRPI